MNKGDWLLTMSCAQKMGKLFGRCASKQARTELVEGLGITYGFHMAREESMDDWLTRVLYYVFYYEKPFQKQVAASGCDIDGIPRGP